MTQIDPGTDRPTPAEARTVVRQRFGGTKPTVRQGSSGPPVSEVQSSLNQAIGAGLVDEFHLFLCPVLVGGGKRTLPDNVRARLELLDERRFTNGFVHLHYRVSA